MKVLFSSLFLLTHPLSVRILCSNLLFDVPDPSDVSHACHLHLLYTYTLLFYLHIHVTVLWTEYPLSLALLILPYSYLYFPGTWKLPLLYKALSGPFSSYVLWPTQLSCSILECFTYFVLRCIVREISCLVLPLYSQKNTWCRSRQIVMVQERWSVVYIHGTACKIWCGSRQVIISLHIETLSLTFNRTLMHKALLRRGNRGRQKKNNHNPDSWAHVLVCIVALLLPNWNSTRCKIRTYAHAHTHRMGIWPWHIFLVGCQYFFSSRSKVGKTAILCLVELWVENKFHNKPQWFSTDYTNPKTISNHLVAIVLQKKQNTDMLSVSLKFIKTRWKGM